MPPRSPLHEFSVHILRISRYDKPVFRGRRFLVFSVSVFQRFSVSQRSRHTSHVTRHSAAFTLLELLVVMGIIALLLAALIPAIGISKSSGRKGAVSNLLGAIEQARGEAIKSGQATYVVFPTFSSGTSQTTLDRYNYKSFAVFEDDPANPTMPKQVTKWQTFPTGIAIRAAGSSPLLSTLANPTTLTPAIASFPFTPDASATPTYRCIKYNANGEIEAPTSNVTLTIFEGYINNGTEVITSTKNSNGDPAASESITIARLTGRAERQ